MYQQTIPRATRRYSRVLLREQVVLERRLKSVFRRVDSSFGPVAPLVAATIARSQQVVADAGMAYTEDLLGGFVEGVGEASVAPLIGVTGAGVTFEEVFSRARPMTTQDSLRLGLTWALQLARTALGDTGRQSVALGMGTRQCGGYMRALVGKTCARCAVLAGRLYWTEEPFKRHPQCDCQHIPYRDEPDEKYLVNGSEYFDSLSPDEQDSVFTKAGAEAIRNGADLNQVVNARRGMSSVVTASGRRRLARVGGIYRTSEGVTRRGYARSVMRSGQARKMPEQLIADATVNNKLNREELHRLLKIHGYVL